MPLKPCRPACPCTFHTLLQAAKTLDLPMLQQLQPMVSAAVRDIEAEANDGNTSRGKRVSRGGAAGWMCRVGREAKCEVGTGMEGWGLPAPKGATLARGVC